MKDLIAWATVLGISAAHADLVDRLARKKSLSRSKWAGLGYFFPGPALVGVLLARPQTRVCLRCRAEYPPLTEVCRLCEIPLLSVRPNADLMDQRDGQCPGCAAPFLYSDYRSDAKQLLCSDCGTELPKPAMVPPARAYNHEP